jgi:hypothetical protein
LILDELIDYPVNEYTVRHDRTGQTEARKLSVSLTLSANPDDEEGRNAARAALGIMEAEGYNPDPQTLASFWRGPASDTREEVTTRLPGRRNSAPVYQTRSVTTRTLWDFTAYDRPAEPVEPVEVEVDGSASDIWIVRPAIWPLSTTYAKHFDRITEDEYNRERYGFWTHPEPGLDSDTAARLDTDRLDDE